MSLDGNDADRSWNQNGTSRNDGTDYGSGTAYGSAGSSYSADGYGQNYTQNSGYGQYGSYQGGSGYGQNAGYGNPYFGGDAAESQPRNVYSNVSPGGAQYLGGGFPPYAGPRGPVKVVRKIGRGIAALIAVIALVLGALIGAGIAAADSRAHIDALESQLEQLRQNNNGNGGGGSGPDGLPGAPNDPYMPQPKGDQDVPNSGDDNGPVKRGTRVTSAPGVVLINTSLLAGVGAGTGMIISSDGLVLTNYHVVQGSSDVKVTVNDTDQSFSGTVVGHDEEHDVALVQLKGASGLKTVSIASSPITVGDSVSAVGNSSGQGYLSKLTGKVIGTQQDIVIRDEGGGRPTKLRGLIVTDADVVPGYSGGPMFNAAGQVVGMNSAASVGKTSRNVNGFAIPIGEAMDIATKIKNGEGGGSIVIGRNAALGITVGQSSTGEGVGVLAIDPSSNARQAGLSRGDVITEINGDRVNTASDLARTVRGMQIGDTVTLTVRSQGTGTPHSITVKLVESTVN